MNLKLIKLNKNDYSRIKDKSLALSKNIPAQEIFGVFDEANMFIYEYDNAVKSGDSNIHLLLPVLDPYHNPINRFEIITKLFASVVYARINKQSMFFIKDNKILEIS